MLLTLQKSTINLKDYYTQTSKFHILMLQPLVFSRFLIFGRFLFLTISFWDSEDKLQKNISNLQFVLKAFQLFQSNKDRSNDTHHYTRSPLQHIPLQDTPEGNICQNNHRATASRELERQLRLSFDFINAFKNHSFGPQYLNSTRGKKRYL